MASSAVGTFCRKHQFGLSRFCVSCNQFTCHDCWKEEHESHIVLGIPEAAGRARQDISLQNAELKTSIEILEKQRQEIVRKKQELCNTATEWKEAAKEKVVIVENCLKEILDERFKDADTVAAEENQNLTKFEAELDSKQKRMKDLQSQTQKLLESKSDVEQIKFMKTKVTSAREYVSSVLMDEISYDVQVAFAETATSDFEEGIKRFIGDPVIAQVGKQSPSYAVLREFRRKDFSDSHPVAMHSKDGIVSAVYSEKKTNQTQLCVLTFDTTDHVLLRQTTKLIESAKISRFNGKELLVYPAVVGNGHEKIFQCQHGKSKECVATSSLRTKSSAFAFKQSKHKGMFNICKKSRVDEPWRKICRIYTKNPTVVCANSSETYFAVIEECVDPKKCRRSVVLFQKHQAARLAEFPNMKGFYPCDVCFFTVDNSQMLLVADQGNSKIWFMKFEEANNHEIEDTPEECEDSCEETANRFAVGEFCSGCSWLQGPTALAVDSERKLWIGCDGGVILKCIPTSDLRTALKTQPCSSEQWDNYEYMDLSASLAHALRMRFRDQETERKVSISSQSSWECLETSYEESSTSSLQDYQCSSSPALDVPPPPQPSRRTVSPQHSETNQQEVPEKKLHGGEAQKTPLCTESSYQSLQDYGYLKPTAKHQGTADSSPSQMNGWETTFAQKPSYTTYQPSDICDETSDALEQPGSGGAVSASQTILTSLQTQESMVHQEPVLHVDDSNMPGKNSDQGDCRKRRPSGPYRYDRLVYSGQGQSLATARAPGNGMVDILGTDKFNQIQPVVSTEWQAVHRVPKDGGIIHTATVSLHVPEGALADESVVICSAVCADSGRIKQFMKLADAEQVVSPFAEFWAGDEYRFKKPIQIILPHFLPFLFNKRQVRVYCMSYSGAQVQLKCVQPQNSVSDQTEDASVPFEMNGYFEILSSGFVRVTIDHMAGYVCTYRNSSQSQFALAYEHDKSSSTVVPRSALTRSIAELQRSSGSLLHQEYVPHEDVRLILGQQQRSVPQSRMEPSSPERGFEKFSSDESRMSAVETSSKNEQPGAFHCDMSEQKVWRGRQLPEAWSSHHAKTIIKRSNYPNCQPPSSTPSSSSDVKFNIDEYSSDDYSDVKAPGDRQPPEDPNNDIKHSWSSWSQEYLRKDYFNRPEGSPEDGADNRSFAGTNGRLWQRTESEFLTSREQSRHAPATMMDQQNSRAQSLISRIREKTLAKLHRLSERKEEEETEV